MSPIFRLQATIEAIDKVSGPSKKMMESLQGLERLAQKSEAMINYGHRLSLTGGLVNEAGRRMLAVADDILAPSKAFEAAAKPLETVISSTLGSVAKSMAMAKKAALEWSKAHADSAADFLAMSYRMASAGLNDVQAIEATRQALRVAKATLAADVPAVGELIATLYNNLADKAKPFTQEFQRIADVVTRTQQYFQFKSIDVLAGSLKYATPAAIAFRIPLEEVATVIGQLNNAGLQGEIAGTAYAATLRQMTRASRLLGFQLAKDKNGALSFIGTLRNIVARYGDLSRLSDEQRMKFQQAFGDEGLRAVMLLAGKLGEMDRALKVVTNSTGAAARAQRMMEQSALEQEKILQNRLDALRITVGNALLPTLNRVIPVIGRLLERFGRFAEAHPNLAKTALLFTAIGGAALAVLGPFLNVAGALMAVTGHIFKCGMTLRKGILLISTFIKAGGLKQLTTGFLGAARAAGAFAASLLTNPITWIVLGIAAATAGIVLLARNWRRVSAWLKAGWAWVVEGFGKILAWFRASPVGKAVLVLLAAFMPLIGLPLLIAVHWQKIVAVARDVWAGVAGILQAAAAWIRGLFSGLVQQALAWGRNLLAAFIKGIKERVAKLSEALRGAAEKIKNFLGFHSPAREGPGATAHKWAPALMSMYALGIRRGAREIRVAALAAAMGVAGAFTTVAPSIPMAAPTVMAAPLSPGTGGAMRAASGMQIVIHFHDRVVFELPGVHDGRSFFEELIRLAGEVGGEA